MNATRRTHLEAIPPVPAILIGMVSVQTGAALAKGLFPALGPIGTVGLRVALSTMMLLAAFRPRVRGMTAAQWRAVIPYGVVLGAC
jgi:inner membrane transporter RhtA